ncbi:MAG: hypothetical protein ACRBK7_04545 [Acidimicrobiales bacterium]
MGKTTLLENHKASPGSRYEFRVWGKQKQACRTLSKIADRERLQRLDDLYFLDGDPASSTKIRRRRLKVKRLQEVRLGFERWSTTWHRVPSDAPKPFDAVLKELQHCKPGSKDYDQIIASVASGLKPKHALRAVLVTKDRRRFRFGAIRAEATTVQIEGCADSLTTVAIEGPDLLELVELRERLGLEKMCNVAVHQAVGMELDI